jgi:hypothetical protein
MQQDSQEPGVHQLGVHQLGVGQLTDAYRQNNLSPKEVCEQLFEPVDDACHTQCYRGTPGVNQP